MSKIKLFVGNFIIYGFGGVISKIIPLVMVPIITRIMPTTEYFGISDLSNTVVQFGSAIAIMGMYDAMYRMFFEKDEVEYKKKVCSTALFFTLITSVIVFGIMILTKDLIAQFFFGDSKYAYVVYLSAIATLVGATNSIISAPTRMQNMRKIYLITNTLGPLISYGISIALLLAGYYVIALPLAAVVSGVVMEVSFALLNKRWFDIKWFDTELLKNMFVIAIPLLPNILIYWVFNSCDKVMITNILGIGDSGVYSVGSKLGHASHLIYLAFAGGWQYFAFSTMKEDNQVKTTSHIFEYLGIISYIATAYVCATCYLLFQLLFTKEYVAGYIIAPYLFLAPLLQMLYQVSANQFLVVKKTWPNMFVLGCGAIFNIIANIILIPIIGIEGAAIATLMGYAVSDIICIMVLRKMGLIEISPRFIIASIFMVVFMLIWRLFISIKTIYGLLSATLLLGIMFFLYNSDIKMLLARIKNE